MPGQRIFDTVQIFLGHVSIRRGDGVQVPAMDRIGQLFGIRPECLKQMNWLCKFGKQSHSWRRTTMESEMTCPNCRFEIQEGSDFCSECGYRLPAQGGGGLVWYWLGILLVVCCAIAWALLLIGISVDSEDWPDVILGGVIITVISLALGVFLIKRRRKVPSHHSDTGNATNYEDPKDERRYR